MNDKPKIVVGLAVVLAGLTFPLWYQPARGRSPEPPALELPAGRSRCVEDAPYMRAHHGDLLRQWRDWAVREGSTIYVSRRYGESHQMSLTRTCLRCHASPKAFCDRCHTYANAVGSITCWECHVEPDAR